MSNRSIVSGLVLVLSFALLPSAVCSGPSVEDSTGPVLKIPAALFKGEGLELRSNDGPGISSKALLKQGFYAGLTRVAKEFSTPAKGYPGDEYLQVLRGWLRLTETDKTEQLFPAGSRAFIPKGWQGVWTNSADYLEFVITSTEFLAGEANSGWPPNAPIDLEARILAIDLRRAPEQFCIADGDEQRSLLACWSGDSARIIKNRIAAEYQVAEQALQFSMPDHALDEYVEILFGTLTLWPKDAAPQTYIAGDHIIVSSEFSGRVAFSDGYRGLVISGDPPDA